MYITSQQVCVCLQISERKNYIFKVNKNKWHKFYTVAQLIKTNIFHRRMTRTNQTVKAQENG